MAVSAGKEKIVLVPYTFWPGETKWVFFGNPERKTDPVNILFEGTSLDAVSHMFQDHGWTEAHGGRQIAYVGNSRVSTQAQFAYALTNGERFHVRLFPYQDLVLGAAHLETETAHGHRVLSWEEAERMVAAVFSVYPHATTAMLNAVDFRGVENNGKATIIDLSRHN